MLKSTARTQAWLADLAAIITATEAHDLPSPQAVRKRKRTLKPLGEE